MDSITIRMTEEDLKGLCHKCEDNALYAAVVRALADRPLSTFAEYIEEWSQHWPIISSDLTLTGTFTDCQEGGDWYNYDDVAMIECGEALRHGWIVDALDDRYALPPQDS